MSFPLHLYAQANLKKKGKLLFVRKTKIDVANECCICILTTSVATVAYRIPLSGTLENGGPTDFDQTVRREMIRELMSKIGRFLFTLVFFSIITPYVVLTAVPGASLPGLIAASIVAALIVAMYDLGVFRVECEV